MVKTLCEKITSQFRDMQDTQLRSMEHTFDNNLIIRGIPAETNETAPKLRNIVKEMIQKRLAETRHVRQP